MYNGYNTYYFMLLLRMIFYPVLLTVSGRESTELESRAGLET